MELETKPSGISTWTFTPEVTRNDQKVPEITKKYHHDKGDWVERVDGGYWVDGDETGESGDSGESVESCDTDIQVKQVKREKKEKSLVSGEDGEEREERKTNQR